MAKKSGSEDTEMGESEINPLDPDPRDIIRNGIALKYFHILKTLVKLITKEGPLHSGHMRYWFQTINRLSANRDIKLGTCPGVHVLVLIGFERD